MKPAEGKMKFLAVKLTALRSELKISREILSKVSVEVDKMYHEKYFPERPVNQLANEETDIDEHQEDGPEQEDTEQEGTKQRVRVEQNVSEPESANKNVDPEVRKMFKKIATKCHPDKLMGLDGGFEKNRKEELFERARAAFEDDDIVTMSHIAMELGVEVPEITEDQLKETENKIIAIKKELSQIESTYVWRWFFTSDSEQKDNILQELFNIMYENTRKQNLRT